MWQAGKSTGNKDFNRKVTEPNSVAASHVGNIELPRARFGRNSSSKSVGSCWFHVQWVDLRENLEETIDFPMKYGIFL